MTLTDDELTIGDQTWKEGEDQCDGEDAELVVAQWKDVETNEGEPALIRRDFDSIRFRDDGEGYTIAFVPEGTTDIPKPESSPQLDDARRGRRRRRCPRPRARRRAPPRGHRHGADRHHRPADDGSPHRHDGPGGVTCGPSSSSVGSARACGR